MKALDLPDMLIVLGVLILVAGVAAVYLPAGAIVLGVLLVVGGVIISPRKNRTTGGG